MDYFHWRRPGRQETPQSGLTGPADVPEPPAQKPRDLKDRLASVREAAHGTVAALPKVLRLVWEASPPLTVGLATATVLAGFVPAATAYTAKLLINAVVQAILVRARHAPDQTVLTLPLPLVPIHSPVLTTTGAIVALAVVQFAIYAVSSSLSTLRNITQQLLQERVTLTIQLLVMEHAARLGRPGLADPRVRERHPLRLEGVQHRPVGLSHPPPDAVPDHAGHDRHLRQGGQAVRAGRILHPALPPARPHLLRPAAPAGHRALRAGQPLGPDHHPRRVGHLPVRRPPGGRGPADPRRPDALHLGGLVDSELDPGPPQRVLRHVRA